MKAVIFDMDGLLIDSEPMWRDSHIRTLAKHNVVITQDDIRAMAGRRTDEVVEHWRTSRNLQHVPAEQLQTEIVSRVIDEIKINGAMLPGVEQTIRILQTHNVPMAVASSSPPEIIEVVLNKLDLAKYMQLAYSAVSEEFGKPHPGVFLTTAQKLNVTPQDCVVFEDSVSGVRAAKAAGMKCVAVPELPNRGRPEYNEADLVIDTLEEVEWETLEQLYKSKAQVKS